MNKCRSSTKYYRKHGESSRFRQKQKNSSPAPLAKIMIIKGSAEPKWNRCRLHLNRSRSVIIVTYHLNSCLCNAALYLLSNIITDSSLSLLNVIGDNWHEMTTDSQFALLGLCIHQPKSFILKTSMGEELLWSLQSPSNDSCRVNCSI